MQENLIDMEKQHVSKIIMLLLGVGMILYHLVSSQYLIVGQWEHQTIHLAFILIIPFLSLMLKTSSLSYKIAMGVCILLSISTCAYIFLNIAELEATQGFPEPVAVLVGLIVIVLVFISTILNWGLPLPIVAGVFVLYFFFGHHLGGPLYHREFEVDYIISYLCIGLSGVYGMFLSISANQVFLFVIFGAFLSAFRITGLFMEFGKIVGSSMRGGPGLTAVVASSLVGMVSGAPVANVAITGAFTIPYMKKVGYTAEEAGAIEAVASTGGQLMPPVMGAAAFLMATFIGEPYSVVMLAGILPAIIFYYSVAVSVQFLAASKNLPIFSQKVNLQIVWRRLPVFLLPISLTFYLLLARYSPMNVAFWAILLTLVVGFAQKETRPSWRELLANAADGALVGAKIGISLALVGIMAQTLVTTGLGSKISSLVAMLCGDSLLLALILTMLVSLVLGFAVPPAAAYALCAVVVVPTIVPLGVDLLRAHFFCFYFAIISAITPPVGLAALAAAGMSGGNYFKTGLKAFKLAISGFLLPYIIVYSPVFNFDTSNFIWLIASFIGIIVVIFAQSALIYNCCFRQLTFLEKMMAAGIVLLGYLLIFAGGEVNQTVQVILIASTLTLLFVFFQRQRKPLL